MRKKLFVLGLGLCLFAVACSGKKVQEEHNSKQSTEENEQKKKKGEDKDDAEKKDKAQTGTPETNEKEEQDGEDEPGKELSKEPEVTFTDYSRKIEDEDTGALLLSVTENCPVISIPENEAVAEKMNMVFEQQHTTNQVDIEKDAELAKDAYKGLSKEEASAWRGYNYGVSYKVVYASTKILSIESQTYQWQQDSEPNTWTSCYCFDVTTGNLLYLSDIFTDKAKAGKIVEQHILDTITKKPYKDALMEDYESYISDILTEDVFYLNEKGLVVICNPNMVTTDTTGAIEIEVPYKELKDVMKEAYFREP